MSILFAIVLFSLLILVHELGHFAAAKLSGVQVNEFSMFMGPALWKKQVGETLYSLRLVPLGGYCAMEGEDGGSDSPRSFDRAAWWKKLIILVAGAAMNFIMGILLLAVFCIPIQRITTPVIDSFEDYSTVTGLQAGDRILEMDGEKIYVYSDISMLLTLNQTPTHDFVVERKGEKTVLEDIPMEKVQFTGEDGQTRAAYGMNFNVRDLSWTGKLEHAWNMTLDSVRMVRLSLQMIASGQAGLKDMSGPVGIVQQMSMAADAAPNRTLAIMNLLYFGGFIAINLGVMNLLPIPALDGGRVVGVVITTAVEAVTKKKLDPKYEGYLHAAGMLVLLGLMAVVMFKDIIFLFRG